MATFIWRRYVSTAFLSNSPPSSDTKRTGTPSVWMRRPGPAPCRRRVCSPRAPRAASWRSRRWPRGRTLTPEIIAALKFQIARVRQLQTEAEIGIAYLDKVSRPCIRAASELYCGIVDEVEAIGYDIFNKRAKTSTGRRARVAGVAYLQAIAARIR